MCFSKARENLGASLSAVISAQSTCCIINSCNTTRREITKHHPWLKPLPKSKCCSRPLKLGASRSGSLSVRSSKSHSFSHTMKQSDSFQIQGEYVTRVDPTMDKEREEGLEESTTGDHAPLLRFISTLWDCRCPKVEHFSLQVQMNEIRLRSRERWIYLLIIGHWSHRQASPAATGSALCYFSAIKWGRTHFWCSRKTGATYRWRLHMIYTRWDDGTLPEIWRFFKVGVTLMRPRGSD